MEIFRFDRGEKIVRAYGSEGFRATRIAAGDGRINLTCLTIEPGGVIGTHHTSGTDVGLTALAVEGAAGPMARMSGRQLLAGEDLDWLAPYRAMADALARQALEILIVAAGRGTADRSRPDPADPGWLRIRPGRHRVPGNRPARPVPAAEHRGDQQDDDLARFAREMLVSSGGRNAGVTPGPGTLRPTGLAGAAFICHNPQTGTTHGRGSGPEEDLESRSWNGHDQPGRRLPAEAPLGGAAARGDLQVLR